MAIRAAGPRVGPLDLATGALNAITLYRPVGPAELELIAAPGWREFPPRLPGQPIFYPVPNEGYAAPIVTRFQVPAEFAERYPRQVVGGRQHEELWVPAALWGP